MAERKNYALIIGNREYQNIKKLHNPKYDAKDLSEALKKLGFKVSCYADLEKRAMEEAIQKFCQKIKGHLALFYFAGHGLQLENQRISTNYLLPVDVNINSKAKVKDTAISANYIADELADADSPIRIMILDACREIPDFFADKRHLKHGLAEMPTDTGMLIAYSTSENAIAYDGDVAEKNSPYMKHLKRFITDKALHIEEIFQETRYAVAAETAAKYGEAFKQQPKEYSGFSRRVYFIPTQPKERVDEMIIESNLAEITFITNNKKQSKQLPHTLSLNPETKTVEIRLADDKYINLNLSYKPLPLVTASTEVSPSVDDTASGIIQSKEELIQALARAGTLHLAATDFYLDDTLLLRHDVTLIGAGYQKTRIISSAPDYVLRYQGDGTLKLQGIGFEHKGDMAAHVMGADGGILDIEACSFTGGLFDEKAYWGGNGLRVIKDARGSIRESFFSNNDIHGIQMTDDVMLELANNRFHDNQGSGIVYFDNSAGNASYNASFDNQQHGVVMMNNAEPQLEHNKIYRNRRYGIYHSRHNYPNYAQLRAKNTIEHNREGDFGSSN